MALVSILDLETEIVPFFRLAATDVDQDLLLLLQTWTENQARKFAGHVISQNTITGELQPTTGRTGDDYQALTMEGPGAPAHYGHDASNILQLDNGYVRSITTLHADSAANYGQGEDAFAAATLLTAGTDFWMESDKSGLSVSGRLIRNGSWPSQPGTVKITYVAGLTTAELADEYSFVKLALLEDMQVKFNAARSQRSNGGGPIKKENFHGDYSVEYAVDSASRSLMALSPGAMAKLQPIRRYAL